MRLQSKGLPALPRPVGLVFLLMPSFRPCILFVWPTFACWLVLETCLMSQESCSREICKGHCRQVCRICTNFEGEAAPNNCNYSNTVEVSEESSSMNRNRLLQLEVDCSRCSY